MSDEFDTLEEKIRAARAQEQQSSNPPSKRSEEDSESMNVGIRAGAELTGAIMGGGFIGWALDRWLDTSPLFLILLLVFGVGTGFYNVYRLTQNPSQSSGFSGLHKRRKTAKNPPDEKESF